MTDEAKRRTIRRYAHELYPHPDDWEVRPLAVDVRYALAQAIGTKIEREWHDLIDAGGESARLAADRTMYHLARCEIALLAVALHEGLGGEDVWEFAQERASDEVDTIVWEYAVKYGIDPDAIKPYAIRSEPDSHQHWAPRDERGWRTLLEHRVEGKESECAVCTEAVDA